MNQFWVPSKKRISGYKCVEHSITKELTLVGKYGEIWPSAPFTFKAVIFSGLIAKRFLPEQHWPQQPGDEVLVRFGATDLPIWIERLKVPVKPTTQAEIANRSRNESPVNSNEIEYNADKLSFEALIQAQTSQGYLDLPPGPKNSSKGSKTKNRGVA